METKFLKIIGVALMLTLGFAGFAYAYTIEKYNFANEGDIVVGPGKTDVALNPGDTLVKNIIVSNRSGQTKIINISVEDFEAGDKDQTLKFMGTQQSPYSLKDFIKPETNQVTLNFGERLTMPVTITIPKNAEPGGLYAAVMVSASNPDNGKDLSTSDSAAGKVKITTRIASLFFVRVNGAALEQGALKDFSAQKSFYENGPVNFEITADNTGNVHLSPYGIIEVKNILGAKIDERQIDPWFVMPKSERTREIKWNSNFLLGRYTATLSLNRGYKNIIDQKTISFWVIPWKILSIILIGIILIVWLIVWLIGHIQWKKSSGTGPESQDNYTKNEINKL